MHLDGIQVSFRRYLTDATLWSGEAGRRSGLSGAQVSIHDVPSALDGAMMSARIPEDEFQTHVPFVGHLAQAHNRAIEAVSRAVFASAGQVTDRSQRIHVAHVLQLLSAAVSAPLEQDEAHPNVGVAKARGAAQLVGWILTDLAARLNGPGKRAATTELLRCGIDLKSASMPLGELQIAALRARMNETACALRTMAMSAGASVALGLASKNGHKG